MGHKIRGLHGLEVIRGCPCKPDNYPYFIPVVAALQSYLRDFKNPNIDNSKAFQHLEPDSSK